MVYHSSEVDKCMNSRYFNIGFYLKWLLDASINNTYHRLLHPTV